MGIWEYGNMSSAEVALWLLVMIGMGILFGLWHVFKSLKILISSSRSTEYDVDSLRKLLADLSLDQIERELREIEPCVSLIKMSLDRIEHNVVGSS